MRPTPPMVTVQPTRYEVTAYPGEDAFSSHWALTVEYRGAGRWAVLHEGLCLNHQTGQWDVESVPSERRESWINDHRFYTAHGAVAVARDHALKVKVLGMTLDEAIERANA